MAQQFVLETSKDEPKIDLQSAMVELHKRTGKSPFQILPEIWRLMRGRGELSLHDYFEYRLYDDDRLAPEDKAAFLGTRATRRITTQILKSPWLRFTNDKVLVEGVLKGAGIPTPETVAIFHPFRTTGPAVALRSADDIAGFLRSASYPLFGKPISMVNSLAVVSLEGHDGDKDELITSNGSRVAVEDLAAQIAGLDKGGYLFQKRLETHDAWKPLVGDRVSSVRFYCLMDKDGPHLMAASWKVRTGENFADNYWRKGNLLGAIDLETGTVTRVIDGIGMAVEEISAHPDTGAALVGTKIPEWETYKATCLKAASAFPDCPVQGWDIAFTSSGPVVIEIEGDGGHPRMAQLAQDKGLYRGRFKEMIDRAIAKDRRSGKGRRKRRLMRNFQKAAGGN